MRVKLLVTLMAALCLSAGFIGSRSTAQTATAGTWSVVPAQQTALTATVRPPIKADGSSVFNAKRGVVPIKFTANRPCDQLPATIVVTRIGGQNQGVVNESVYASDADDGTAFRITECTYHYNLAVSTFGPVVYRVDIVVDGVVVGSATFALR